MGWYLSIPGCSMELHEVICRTHLDHFGGNDKVLMVMEPLEKEEAFYRYEDGELSRQPGFYIYYEKNEPMQNFLVAQNDKAETKSEQVSDQAVKTFRKKVETKSEGKKQTKNTSVFRTASVCMMVAVLAVGVLYLNDYHKLKKTETVISKWMIRTAARSLWRQNRSMDWYPRTGKRTVRMRQTGRRREQTPKKPMPAQTGQPPPDRRMELLMDRRIQTEKKRCKGSGCG